MMPPPEDETQICFPVLKIEIPTIQVSRTVYLQEMAKHGVVPLGDPFDISAYIADKSDLDKIAPYLVYSAEWYVEQIWDCEDYALRGMSDAGLFYKVNGIRAVFGDTDYGYHGYLATLDKRGGIWLLENNAGFPWAGEWFKPNDPDRGNYRPKKVLI